MRRHLFLGQVVRVDVLRFCCSSVKDSITTTIRNMLIREI